MRLLAPKLLISMSIFIGGMPILGHARIPQPELQKPRLSLRIEDPNFVLQESQKSLLHSNIQAAFNNWAEKLDSKAELVGLVKVTRTSVAKRVDCASTGNIEVGKENGVAIIEESAAFKIRTGKSVKPGNPDLVIQIDPHYFASELWLDPQPSLRTEEIPSNKIDAISVFTHEFAHAFGFQTFRNRKTGEAGQTWKTLFDRFVRVSPNGIEYHGPDKKSFKLTSSSKTQNITHLGDSAADDTANDLMNGVGFRHKTRYEISATDLKIMRDLGLPVKD